MTLKKELAAGALLAALIAASFVNISYLEGFITSLSARVSLSRSFCEAGDFENAEAALRGAVDAWTSADGYTHIFIRHSEIDAAADAFYDVLGALAEGEAGAAEGAYEKLSTRLAGLYTMERVTLGSIF